LVGVGCVEVCHNAEEFIFRVITSAILGDIIHLNKQHLILFCFILPIFADNVTYKAIFTAYLMKFGEKITKLKKLKKMSQVELAEKTGISRDAISKYERGDVSPSVEYAKRIAEALGVSLDYLVSDSEQDEALDNETVKRVKEIQTLPLNEKDKIHSVIDALIRDFKTKQAYK
jgi:transcriptional regulator with XRE-family HTH domain